MAMEGADATSEDLCLMAVPKKGRLYELCIELLKGVGISFKRAPRQDIAYCTSLPIKLVFLPAKDIAQFVGEGNVDIGLTGQDMVAEAGVTVSELLETGFGKCKLALLAPDANKVTDPKELIGKRIATSFPNLTKEFLNKLDPSRADTTIIRNISGSVEAACGLGLADAVVDLWETGTTARAAGLGIVHTILETQTVVIANPHSTHQSMIELLQKRIAGYLLAKQNAMIYYNVAREKLEEATKITPGKKRPTITPLANDDWVSVGAMVHMKEVNNLMDSLQELGATDIFVVDLMNCRT